MWKCYFFPFFFHIRVGTPDGTLADGKTTSRKKKATEKLEGKKKALSELDAGQQAGTGPRFSHIHTHTHTQMHADHVHKHDCNDTHLYSQTTTHTHLIYRCV